MFDSTTGGSPQGVATGSGIKMETVGGVPGGVNTGSAHTMTVSSPQQQDQGIFGKFWDWLFGGGGGSTQDPADTSIIPLNGIAATPEVLAPPPALPSGNQKTKARLTGISNQDGRGQVDPRVFGTNKVFPVKAARVITETRGGQQYMSALFSLGYGPLDISDIRIGDKPIAEYEEIEYEVREGTTGDAAITLYTQDVEQDEFNELLSYNKEVVKLADQNAIRIVVEVFFPAGLFTKTVDELTGEETFSDRTVSIKVEYRVSGSAGPWENGGNITKSANTQDPLYAFKQIKNLTKAVYEVRLTKLTQTNPGSMDYVQWIQMRAYGDTLPVNPRKDVFGNAVGTAYIAIQAKAQEGLQGNIESLSCIVKSKLQHWNGLSWDAAAISNNCADIFAEMVCGQWSAEPADRNTEIHTDSLSNWHNFCVAKGFTFNFVYDQPTDFLVALNQVCAVGLASPAMIDGKWGVVFDTVKTVPAQIITPANILKGSFEGSITWVEDIDAIDFQFVSPDDKWQQTQRPVFTDGKDSSNSHRRQTMAMVGVTNKDHAWKLGRYYLAVAELRREEFTVAMDFEYLRCQRGDLVYFTHDVPQIGLGGSRIKSVQTDGGGNVTGITLCDQFPTNQGTNYDIVMRLPNGTILTRTTVGDNSQKANFVFTQNIPVATNPKPAAGDLVSFGGYLECIVKSIEATENLTARITLTPYAPGIFTADTGTIPEYTPIIVIVDDQVSTVQPPQIQQIVSNEDVLYRNPDGSFITRVQVTMRPPEADIVYWEYQVRANGMEDWPGVSTTVAATSPVFYITGTGITDGSVIDIRIRVKSTLGINSAWVMELAHTVIGQTTQPPNVPFVALDPKLKQLRIFYDGRYGITRPLDFAGYEVRMHWDATGNPYDEHYYAAATTLNYLLTDDIFDISGFASGIKTFLVKAVDVAGNKSAAPYVIRWDFGQMIIENYLQTKPFGPMYNDADMTITNGSVSGGAIHATQIGPGDSAQFWAGSDTDPAHHTGPDTDLFWGDNYNQLKVEWVFAPPVITNSIMKLATTISAEIYRIEYRTQVDELFYGDPSISDSTVFSYQNPDADPFWTPEYGMSPWLPFPTEGIPAKHQRYEFRIVCEASRIESVISEITMIIDGVTQELTRSDVFVSSSGTTRISVSPLTALLSVIPAVQPDPAYPTAFFAVVVDRDPIAGPNIQILDFAGNLVDGLVSVFIKGYQQ